MNEPRILIAGIGNIFFGDDAFGSEVVRVLLQRAWPENVEIADFGIRSIDLAYALMDGYDLTILIDATLRNQRPGTVYLVEPDLDEAPPQQGPWDGHTMDAVGVLAMAQQRGGPLNRVLLVGCEPAHLGQDEQGRLGLSEVVQAAVPKAAELIESLVRDAMVPDRQTTNVSATGE